VTTSPQAILWRLAVTVPTEAAANAASAALETQAPAVSAFETAPGAAWKVEAFADAAPDRAALEAAAAMVALAHGLDAGEGLLAGLTIERLAPRDWVRENQQSFPPLRIGRFFVYGSHHEGRLPPGSIGLLIDAAAAFGTGEHATTRGCLLALGNLAKRRRFRRVLDMGTGTGILAMAAARLWSPHLLACDIDAGSVQVAAENLRRNGLARRITLRRSDGYRDAAVRRGAPYDLIIANILARPLVAMSRDLAAHLAPGGNVVLSGLLAWQTPMVVAAHRRQGLRLRRRVVVDGWVTLVLDG
jgi:ribosomal protein L11 methyltransferase